MRRRLPLLALLLMAAATVGCRLDESDRADLSFISIGRVGSRHPLLVTANSPRSGQPSPFGLVPGRMMPGGGIFQQLAGRRATAQNDVGQRAFVAVVSEKGTRLRAAYRLNGDGRLSLLLKEGAMTDRGRVRHLAPPRLGGIGLDNQGQVALPVEMEDGSPVVVLLNTALS